MDSTAGKNLNKNFYEEHMLDSTVNRIDVWSEEEVMLRKYLKDTSKSVIEAGAGGGRLTFFIESLGFKNITGFDIVEKMVGFSQSAAKRNNSCINFIHADASDLKNINDETHDYLVYIQQVLCFVPRHLFKKSLQEAYRICKKKGVVIFTFLDYDSRLINPIVGTIANTLRKFRGEETSKYHLPWLKLNDSEFNRKIFSRNQPSVYWVKKEDILDKLRKTGFKIIEVNKGNKITPTGNKGALYIICEK